jgi:hypothetical protein
MAVEKQIVGAQRGRRVLSWALVGAVVVAWVLQLVYSKRLVHDFQSVTLSLVVLAVAAAGAALAQARQRLAVGVMIAASGLLTYVAGTALAFQLRIGVECTLCEVVAAAIPYLVAIAVARHDRIPLDRGTTVAAIAAGALASQAGQVLGCPVPHAQPHLLVFHSGGVLLAVILGVLNPLGAPKLERPAT